MQGLNLVILTGNIESDPEVLYDSDAKTAKLSLFTSGAYRGGGWEEGNRGHEVVLRGRLADVAERFLKAGSRVLVVGKLRSSDWIAQVTCQPQLTTEVVAHELFILGDARKPDSSQAAASAAPDPVDDGPF